MFTMEFKTDNAAFEGERGHEEVSRILKAIAQGVDNGFHNGRCTDLNGNTVGSWTLEWREDCPHCQDLPGFNGLGKKCKHCKGTGFTPALDHGK